MFDQFKSQLAGCLKKEKQLSLLGRIQFSNECLIVVFLKELDVVIATV